MLLSLESAVTKLYPVEVSGWDANEDFFVEKCELYWNEVNGRQLSLNSALHNHSMIFVRLIQPAASDRSYPVPYEAEYLTTQEDGRHYFLVHRLRPCAAEEDEGPERVESYLPYTH